MEKKPIFNNFLLMVLCLLLNACVINKKPDNDQTDTDPIAKRGYQIGKAIVSGAPVELQCKPIRAQARHNGCSHADCTAAKNAAATKLRSQVKPTECRRYVRTSTQPCRKVNCK